MLKNSNIKIDRIYRNAISQEDPGNVAAPPDPICAVGPEHVVLGVNSGWALVDKKSMGRLDYAQDVDFFQVDTSGAVNVADPYVFYDEASQRFFGLIFSYKRSDATLTIEQPSPYAGVYPGSKGVQPPSQNFNVTAVLNPANPLDTSSTPLTPASLAGQIGVVTSNGYLVGSMTKGNRVAAAGGVGMLMIQSPTTDGTSINGSSIVPSMIIGNDVGLNLLTAIENNIPIGTGTMKSLSNEEVTIQSTFHIVVSKTSTPKSLTSADWYIYSTIVDPQYGLADYPKSGTSPDHFTIGVQCFVGGNGQFIGSLLVQYLKKDLITGVGPTVSSENFLPDQLFLWPAVFRAPLTDQFLPQYAVALNTENNRFDLAVIQDGQASLISLPFPTPMTFDVVGQKQPAPDAYPLAPNLGPYLAFAPVLVKDSLWFTTVFSEGEQQLIRWFEVDVSRVVTKGEASIRQWGDVRFCDKQVSANIPAINVDREGNMAMIFTVTGVNQPVTIALAGRLRCDPLGTIRYPLTLVHGLNEFSYDGANIVLEDGTDGNRWGDYSGLAVDPCDGTTFYGFTEYPSQLQAYIDPDLATSYAWTTALVSFSFDSMKKEKQTCSASGNCQKKSCGCGSGTKSHKSLPQEKGAEGKVLTTKQQKQKSVEETIKEKVKRRMAFRELQRLNPGQTLNPDDIPVSELPKLNKRASRWIY